MPIADRGQVWARELSPRVRARRTELNLSQGAVARQLVDNGYQTIISQVELGLACRALTYRALRRWLGDRFLPIEDGREGAWESSETAPRGGTRVYAPTVAFATRLPRSLHLAMKWRCIDRDISIQQFIEEAVSWALLYGSMPGLPKPLRLSGRRRVEL